MACCKANLKSIGVKAFLCLKKHLKYNVHETVIYIPSFLYVCLKESWIILSNNPHVDFQLLIFMWLPATTSRLKRGQLIILCHIYKVLFWCLSLLCVSIDFQYNSMSSNVIFWISRNSLVGISNYCCTVPFSRLSGRLKLTLRRTRPLLILFCSRVYFFYPGSVTWDDISYSCYSLFGYKGCLVS